jgi:small multidrug resistance pump
MRATTGDRRWVFLGGAIVTEVTATLSLKAALDAPAFYVLVVAGYLAAFLLLAATLRAGMPLGAAYGIWGAVGVASTAVLSWVFFGEALTWVMGLGIAVIIAGVLLVELGAQAAARADESGGDAT